MNNNYSETENRPHRTRREAVKTFAIIFLAIMLVLTFFSNTIMNWSLPQVSGSYASYGQIVTAIRGSGTVQSNMTYNVTVDSTHKVEKVFVRAGDSVAKGDTLIAFDASDSTELSTAKDDLAKMQDEYNSLVNTKFDYTQQEEAIADLEEKLKDLKAEREFEVGDATITVLEAKKLVREAQAKVDEITAELAAIDKEIAAFAEDPDNLTIYTIQVRLKTLKENLEIHQMDLEEAEAKLNAMRDSNGNPMPGYTESDLNTQSVIIVNLRNTISDETRSITANEARLKDAIADANSVLSDQRNDVQAKLDAANQELTQANKSQALAESIESFDSQIKSAERSLETARTDLEKQKQNDGATSLSNQRRIETLKDSIAKQKTKIEKLEAGDAGSVVANYAGTVTSVNVIAGDTAQAGMTVAVIEVADKGYTLSFSVTNEQAMRLNPGDKGTVSGTYWGRSAEATLVSAKMEAGGKTRLLTFEITGDVTPGQQLKVSVGEKTSYYNSVVPKNALHEDADGTFVLIAKAKSSPLGTRYVATRVACKVVAQDEKNIAIDTDESYFSEYVITSSTKPVGKGDYVRLSEKR